MGASFCKLDKLEEVVPDAKSSPESIDHATPILEGGLTFADTNTSLPNEYSVEAKSSYVSLGLPVLRTVSSPSQEHIVSITDEPMVKEMSAELSTICISGEVQSSFASDARQDREDKSEASGEFASSTSPENIGPNAPIHYSNASGDFSGELEESSEEVEDEEVPNYGDAGFWREVYSGTRSRKHIPQDWLLTYEHFKSLGWHKYLRGGSILELGCGDSEFMSDAYDDGLHEITSTDVAPEIVEIMRARNAALRPRIKYMQNNACDMESIPAKSFDIIFEKGVMDSLICSGKSMTSRCSREVHRVLRDAGIYLCVSLNDSFQMKAAIERTGCTPLQWHVQVLCGDNGEDDDDYQVIYMYVCRKVQIRLR